MRFSVLLPTRDRLALLRYAVESVREQDYDDWEIVVSDNFSEEDIAGYVRALGDPRIKYFRTDRFVSVTDNWNNALLRSGGDYVMMLGDDDCLLPSYFTTVRRLAEEHGHPDVLYGGGYLYAYPGVIPGHPDGCLHRSGCAGFLRRAEKPFLLDRASARQAVEHSVRFRLRFDYNMQYSTISRRIIEALRAHGPFFQSPFPDFYATNALFLKAKRILVCPEPLVVIGVSPKSYGFYHFNKQEQLGVAFLQSQPDVATARRLERIVLPGTNMNTSWLFAMEAIRANYGAEVGLRVRYGRYRALQLLDYYGRLVNRTATPSDIREMRHKLRWWERCLYGGAIGCARLFGRSVAHRLLRWVRRGLDQYPRDWRPEFIPQRCVNIREVCKYIAGRQIRA